jgi:hypothetical protein
MNYRLILGGLVAGSAVAAWAQQAPAPQDQAIQLDPFEVKSPPDNSYGALNSRSAAR